MFKALNIPLTIGFFLLCFWTIALLFSYSRPASPAKPAAGTGVRWLLRCVCLLFLATYLYQATWQLAGFGRPAFMDFMRKYSRRPVNPAKEMASLYDKLECIILPMYYTQPIEFAKVMRSAIVLNGSFYNAERMVFQYLENAYITEE